VWERIPNELSPSPFSAITYYFLAISYKKVDECQKVIECCQELLAKWPGFERAWHAEKMMDDCLRRLTDAAK